MNRYYEGFDKKHFDYIIVDEAHHGASDSYMNVLCHFEPKFTLGMTATPERCDSLNVFDLFDNNVALEDVNLDDKSELALLSNYRKTHSAFRGSGLLANGNEYFLFIDLHKEEGIDEKINYKDKFLSEGYFQWQTPNSTTQGTDRGKNIIFNKDRNVNLHLFVRKYKEVDKKRQPYIYIGKGDTVEFEGEKPITLKLKLHNEVPAKIYREFVEKV